MSTLQNALEVVKKAVDLDNQGKSQEAISMYSLAIDHLQQVNTNDTKTRDLIKSKILEYQNRTQFLKSTLHLSSPPQQQSNINSFPSPPPLQQQSSPTNRSLVEVAVEYANLAVSAESSNQIQNAVMYYKKCADVLEQASKETNDIETRLMLNQKKQEYNSRAESLSSTFNLNSSFVNNNNNNDNNNSNSSNNLPFPQVDDPNLFNSNNSTTGTINTSSNNNFNNSNGFNQSMGSISYIELSNNSTEFIDMAINYATEAIEHDDHLNYEKAIHFYDLSIQYFTAALQHETNQQIRQLILDKSTNSRIRSTFLKNKIQYHGGSNNSEFSSIPMSLQPGQKYKDPVRKKTVFEKLSKTIKGPKNISDHWL